MDNRSNWLKLESICSEYESSWSESAVTRIRTLVESVDESLRADLVAELVVLDCELRTAVGLDADPMDYASLAEWNEQVHSVLGAWHDRTKLSDTNHGLGDTGIGTVPRNIGEFEIVRLIGRGGMGVVYEAIQQSLQRPVAIKALANAHLEDGVLRLSTEARAVAMLHHTNIIEIYGTGVDNNVPFIAMQLVNGSSLTTTIAAARKERETANENNMTISDADRQAEIERIAQIGVDVARALAHAHERGILHRDIKPSNLLIDEQGTTFVSDFGLAKILDDRSDTTRTGDFIGTLRFMAPESVEQEWTVTCDVYSLGMTLFELLTLRPAFAEKSRFQLLAAIGNGVPRGRIRSLTPDVPRDLETIVEKSVSVDPRQRYQTASDFADDLERFLRGEPILARRVRWTERAAKWANRNRTLACLLTTVMLFVAIGFPAVTWLWLDAEQQRAIAGNATSFALQEQQKADLAKEQAVEASNDAIAARRDAEASSYNYSMRLAQVELERGQLTAARQILEKWRPNSATEDRPDRRGWEWYFLDQQLDTSVMQLRTQQYRYFWDVAIRPDGGQLATVENSDRALQIDAPGAVTLWNTQTWEVDRTLVFSGVGEVARVYSANYSPDGKRLVTYHIFENKPTGLLCLWDLTSDAGKPKKYITIRGDYESKFHSIARMPYAQRMFPSARFSSDGKHLILTPLIDVRDSESLLKVSSEEMDGTLAYPLNGDTFLTVNERQITVRRLPSGRVLRQYTTDKPTLLHSFSANRNKILGIGSGQRNLVKTWQFPVRGATRIRDLFLPEFETATLSHDGSDIFVTERNGTIYSRSLNSNVESSNRFSGHTKAVMDLEISRDGSWMATCSLDGTARIWNLNSRPKNGQFLVRPNITSVLSFSPDGNEIHYACRQYDTPKGVRSAGTLSTLNANSDPSSLRIATTWTDQWPRYDLTFSPSGDRLAAPTAESEIPPTDIVGVRAYSGAIGIWSTHDWKQIYTIDAPPQVLSLNWAPPGNQLAVSGAREIRIYELHSNRAECVATLPTETTAVNLALNDQWLAAKFETRICVWAMDDVLKAGNAHPPGSLSPVCKISSDAFGLAFDPRKNRLAAASYGSQKLDVYQLPGGERIFQAPAPVSCCHVIFSPDGHRIATASYSNEVYLYDSDSGERVLTLKGSQSIPGALATNARVVFSPDGRSIATNTYNGRVRLWSVDGDDFPARLRTKKPIR